MAKLTPKKRSSLPTKDFAGPGKSYPVLDKAHARAAEMDAGIAARKGHISTSTKKKIDAKAKKVLDRGEKMKRSTKEKDLKAGGRKANKKLAAEKEDGIEEAGKGAGKMDPKKKKKMLEEMRRH